MTFETPHVTPPPGRWARFTAWQKAALLAAAFLLPCCGGLTVLGALAGDPPDTGAPTDTGVAADSGVTADGSVAAEGDGAAEGGLQAVEEPSAGVPVLKTAPPATSPTSTAVVPGATATATTVVTSAPAVRRPVVVKRTVTETRRVAFGTRRVQDPDLAKGVTRTRTKGVAGARTLTYEVTMADGVQTRRTLVRDRVTRKPVTKVIAVGTRVDEPEPAGGCDPNYGGCVPIASDVDCAGGSGNGPAYVKGPVEVIGSDIYDLDRDDDGYGCN